MYYYKITFPTGAVKWGPLSEIERLMALSTIHSLSIEKVPDLTGRRFFHGDERQQSILCVEDNGDHIIWEDPDEVGAGPNGGRLFCLHRGPDVDIIGEKVPGTSRNRFVSRS